MPYNCYVFEDAQSLINNIEHYKQSGGNDAELKILIKDVDHGQLLSASGFHHVDYLYEMTDANHHLIDQHQTERRPFFFVGYTNGQNSYGAVNGSYAYDDSDATEALQAYGLSEERASNALKALRVGHFLLFVPREETHETYARGHNLHNALSASFGESGRLNESKSSHQNTYFSSALFEI